MTNKVFAAILAGLTLVAGAAAPAWATSRIKDLANVEGVRQNQLIGYGLVVGLNGTGDTLNNIPFTRQSLQAMLERLGVNVRGAPGWPKGWPWWYRRVPGCAWWPLIPFWWEVSG